MPISMPTSSAKNGNSSTFSSEGFDLDAIPNESNENARNDVVLEIGGATSSANSGGPKDAKGKQSSANKELPIELQNAEDHKQKGNEQFKLGNYEGACDCYTDAIEALPTDASIGEKAGPDLLQMMQDFDAEVQERRYAQRRKESNQRYKAGEAPPPPSSLSKSENNNKPNAEKHDDDDESDEGDEDKAKTEERFSPPPHRYSTQLAIYYCNRSASYYHLSKFNNAKDDATIAILYNPSYIKAYLRRMNANESLEQIEDALSDVQTACKLDPTNVQTRKQLQRLEKINNERLEKLKEETMGKLKELGNSLLGNFGLSLDNFKANKDPNTGSYNISFSQNK